MTTDLLELDLRRACATGAFDLEYQPQINLRTKRITGFEALLRWRHPTRGNVPPSEFIPIAERIGLIGDIGKWALEHACRDAVAWPDHIGVAVNLSAAQSADASLPDTIDAALRGSTLQSGRLELEITESAVMTGQQAGLPVFHAIRNRGVRFAIDDFGMGYSSLSHLLQFPFDKIKLDRAFTSRLGPQSERGDVAGAIVRAIVGLCDGLGVVCLAEGVETPEQLLALTAAGCTEIQGYHLCPPLPADAIPAFLQRIDAGEKSIIPAERAIAAIEIPFMQIAHGAGDIIIVTTPDLAPPGPAIVYVNPAFTRLTGYAASEVIGMTPRILQGPGTSRTALDAIGAALRAGRSVHQKVLNYAKCGAPYWLDLRIAPLRDAAGTITHFAAIERDVTMDKRRLDELEYVADRDTLTGIPNRRALMRAMEAEVEAARVQGLRVDDPKPLCLAMIDVDHFKQVNDELGHAVGDAVLFGMADRLAENVRRPDLLGRIGGEEFAVFMPGVALRDGKALAERLCRAVAGAPFDTPSGPVSISVSIGVAQLSPGDGLQELLRQADAAMYASKRNGRNRVRVFPSRAKASS